MTHIYILLLSRRRFIIIILIHYYRCSRFRFGLRFRVGLFQGLLYSSLLDPKNNNTK